jgi:hypothetical protein
MEDVGSQVARQVAMISSMSQHSKFSESSSAEDEGDDSDSGGGRDYYPGFDFEEFIKMNPEILSTNFSSHLLSFLKGLNNLKRQISDGLGKILFQIQNAGIPMSISTFDASKNLTAGSEALNMQIGVSVYRQGQGQGH